MADLESPLDDFELGHWAALSSAQNSVLAVAVKRLMKEREVLLTQLKDFHTDKANGSDDCASMAEGEPCCVEILRRKLQVHLDAAFMDSP